MNVNQNQKKVKTKKNIHNQGDEVKNDIDLLKTPNTTIKKHQMGMILII